MSGQLEREPRNQRGVGVDGAASVDRSSSNSCKEMEILGSQCHSLEKNERTCLGDFLEIVLPTHLLSVRRIVRYILVRSLPDVASHLARREVGHKICA